MKKKAIMYVVLVVALAGGGTLMAMEGKDAVTVAASEKSALLAADSVNQTFQGVGGKVASIAVVEQQQVKKGDVLIQLDTTDIDLQIAKLEGDMEQAEVKIEQAQKSLDVQSEKIASQEKQYRLDLEAAQAAESLVVQGARSEDLKKQELAVEAAKQSAEAAEVAVETAKKNVTVAELAVKTKQSGADLAQTNYDRVKGLYDKGLAAKTDLESAENQLENAGAALETAKRQAEIAVNQVTAAEKQLAAADNAVSQQQTALDKMKAGATAEEKEQAHIKTEKAQEALNSIAQSKEEVANGQYNIDLLAKQKEALKIQYDTLKLQKERMTLVASADGKVTRIVPKIGEMVGTGGVGAVIETEQLYYEVYVSETDVADFEVGGQVKTHVKALKTDVEGTVKSIASAPQYASLRMSREKGLADLSSYIVRIEIARTPELLPGMTVEVKA
ncbi:biotin/lipoyl-binding protein [Paenibacillus thailandensis]|uniref:HlyD family secretion protein n=1 Tax=Paenibacillus thailandensis TaxID=393250 RepID=UPI0036406CF1